MNEFWKDYWTLCKESGAFYKKHWKGCIVLNAALIGAECAWFCRDKLKEKIKEQFHKKDEV